MFVLLLESASAADTPPDFSSYPQSESFRFYLGFQTNAAWNLQHGMLLTISAFPPGGGFALEYGVTESGREFDRRAVCGLSFEASHSKQLSETNFTSLRLSIHKLPTASVSPPIERLVVVSFRDGTNWVTRTYDSDTLPKPMRQIYDIVGERFETRRVK